MASVDNSATRSGRSVSDGVLGQDVKRKSKKEK
jgi:hypothetical protein